MNNNNLSSTFILANVDIIQQEALNYNSLQSETYGMFFSEPVVPSLQRREQLLHWAFEVHDASVVRFAPQPLLALAGLGKESGNAVVAAIYFAQHIPVCRQSLEQ